MMKITIEQLKQIQQHLELVEGAMPDYSLGRGRGYKDDITEFLANRSIVAATDIIDRLIEFMEGE